MCSLLLLTSNSYISRNFLMQTTFITFIRLHSEWHHKAGFIKFFYHLIRLIAFYRTWDNKLGLRSFFINARWFNRWWLPALINRDFFPDGQSYKSDCCVPKALAFFVSWICRRGFFSCSWLIACLRFMQLWTMLTSQPRSNPSKHCPRSKKANLANFLQ